MELDTVLTKSSNAAYRVYDGQATIVLPDGAEVDVLNESGTLVWEAIDGKRSLGQILDKVLAEYEVSREAAQRDILEFITTLHEHRMVS